MRVVFLAPVVALLPRIMRDLIAGPNRGTIDSEVKPPLLPCYVIGFLLTGLAGYPGGGSITEIGPMDLM